jgi:hypothetical protein
MGLKVAVKPPSTPLYTLLLFSILCAISTSLDLVLGITPPTREKYCLSVASIAFCLALISIIGTYPLQNVIPGTNVAPVGKVSLNFPQRGVIVA